MSWSRRRFTGFLASSGLLLGAASLRAEAAAGSFYYQGPPSDHFDGQRFFNPGSTADPRGLGDVLRWRLTEEAEPWPEHYPSPFGEAQPRPASPADLRVTLVGHATFLIQIGGLAILTDPVWSERASPFAFVGPRRHNPPGIRFDDLPRIDAVLISHNHYDHLDLPTLERLWRRDRPRIVAPLGNDTIIRTTHPEIAVTAVDWGDAVTLPAGRGPGIVVTAEPVHHWSARAVSDRNHALWAAYVLDGGRRRVLFAGDTGFDEGRPFRRIAARHPRMDVALLPIGAYEPRWFMRAQHMDPDDAVQALGILQARQALGYHWGTFRLTNEGAERPARDLAAALAARSVAPRRFLAMQPGQVWTA
jgi:L-ascorbate metabolism protein UlaG (beta-lactamase superfamily)